VIHLRLAGERLRALDLDVLRLDLKAIADGIPAGHYRVARVNEVPTRTEGPGNIEIVDLFRRDLDQLMMAEKAFARGEEIIIGRTAALIGGLARIGCDVAIICGGHANPSQARHKYQPLTPMRNGVRLHNADLSKLMTWLLPQLRSIRPAVLTVDPRE
jgi:hypothetical protein